MSVPLDRLYNFLRDQCDQDILIYRWFPHGSRKVEDCLPLKNYTKIESVYCLPVICHDQEPLKFSEHSQNANKIGVFRNSIYHMFNFYDRALLLHSEQQSSELDKFVEAGAIPVYYWSHAVIAHDWYRYAQHDPMLGNKNIKDLFLIYNRAWSGTREYRLKFAELLIQSDLADQCRMGFNPVDQETNYTNHEFHNNNFCIQQQNIEKYFFLNQSDSTFSADYCGKDYSETAIEVVLETLFDDSRWHLTEKTLRPIACGHPFMLAAAPGSLEYLRGYGFQTFAPYIDETYDSITDPVARLQAIVIEMQRIASMPASTRLQLLAAIDAIAKLNQARFFSVDFFKQVNEEYTGNLRQACVLAEEHRHATYFNTHRSFFAIACSPEEYINTVQYVEKHIKISKIQ